ncbi:MAG: hypothetical protein ACI8PZ_003596 [Myxococcota bacterium]|jgi:hypothetical protein
MSFDVHEAAIEEEAAVLLPASLQNEADAVLEQFDAVDAGLKAMAFRHDIRSNLDPNLLSDHWSGKNELNRMKGELYFQSLMPTNVYVSPFIIQAGIELPKAEMELTTGRVNMDILRIGRWVAASLDVPEPDGSAREVLAAAVESGDAAAVQAAIGGARAALVATTRAAGQLAFQEYMLAAQSGKVYTTVAKRVHIGALNGHIEKLPTLEGVPLAIEAMEAFEGYAHETRLLAQQLEYAASLVAEAGD